MNESVAAIRQPWRALWRQPLRPLSVVVAALVVLVAVVTGGRWWLTQPQFSEYPMLQPKDIPTAVAVAPDGAVWFTIEFSDAIGLWRDGRIERFDKGEPNLEPLGLAVAADGSAWYTDAPAKTIGHIDRSGTIETFPLDTPIARLARLAVAPDGAVWFAEASAYSITRLKDGVFQRHVFDTVQGGPFGVAVDAQGSAWATLQADNTLLQITAGGELSTIDIPTRSSQPTDIAVAADGAVWFIEFRSDQIGRYQDGSFTEFKIPGDGPAALAGLAVAPDGAVWFGMLRRHSLGRLQKDEFKEFPLPRADARPYSVSVDSAGNVWYADLSGWLGKLNTD